MVQCLVVTGSTVWPYELIRAEEAGNQEARAVCRDPMGMC